MEEDFELTCSNHKGSRSLTIYQVFTTIKRAKLKELKGAI
jgi:hypothetical protein